MPVEIVAPTYMNPRQKKEDDDRRRKKQRESFERRLKSRMDREIPEDSTICYYA